MLNIFRCFDPFTFLGPLSRNCWDVDDNVCYLRFIQDKLNLVFQNSITVACLFFSLVTSSRLVLYLFMLSIVQITRVCIFFILDLKYLRMSCTVLIQQIEM